MRPSRLRPYANATPITTRAPTVAWSGPVVSGTSERVVAPGPIRSHSRSTLCVISSTAKVAIPAASPVRRINGNPTRNAKTPPTAAATASDARLPMLWSRRTGNRPGSTELFSAGGTVSTPATNAPTATKLICPKERTPELPTKT
jgi:hypothetical protein